MPLICRIELTRLSRIPPHPIIIRNRIHGKNGREYEKSLYSKNICDNYTSDDSSVYRTSYNLERNRDIKSPNLKNCLADAKEKVRPTSSLEKKPTAVPESSDRSKLKMKNIGYPKCDYRNVDHLNGLALPKDDDPKTFPHKENFEHKSAMIKTEMLPNTINGAFEDEFSDAKIKRRFSSSSNSSKDKRKRKKFEVYISIL